MRSSITAARLATLAVAAASVVAGVAATATPATAASGTFSQPSPIQVEDGVTYWGGASLSVPTDGTATPYPAESNVNGETRLVSDVNVYLTGFNHASPDDLDVLLVGPGGQQAVLMSEATDGTPASGVAFRLDDEAATGIPAAPADQGNYRPTNVGAGDSWPAPAPVASAAGTSLSVFDGTDPNGTWSLYVNDPVTDNGGTFGWTLEVALQGATAPYPSTLEVSGLPRGVTDVNATLNGLSHTYPDDLDVMLVGPSGQNVLLMSDAGNGDGVTALDLTFDDEAAEPAPDEAVLTSTPYQPTNHENFDTFGAPAPSPSPSGGTLASFDGTDPNGTWKLFVVDDAGADVGEFAGGWSLSFTTVDAPAAPTLTSPATGSIDDDGIVTFAGTAPAGTTVGMLDGSAPVASTIASGLGAFSVALAGVANGTHTYTATATDGYGNTSARSGPTTVTVDTVAPIGFVSVDRGAARTNRAAVTLTLSAADPAPGTGVTQMRFSNDGKTFSAFEPLAATKAWSLTATNGTKTVWAQYVDKAAKVSATVADSIVLDTVRPTVVLTKPIKKNGVKVGRNFAAKLSEAVAAGSVTKANVKLVKAGTKKAIRAAITYNTAKHRIRINPKRHLAHDTTYKITIGTGVKDLAGNNLDQKRKTGLQPKTWRITTS